MTSFTNMFPSHSQARQDHFVLKATDFKRGGYFLEVGAQHPCENNNTYGLHTNHEWQGVSIEIDPTHLQLWRQTRPNSPLLIADALSIDYHSALPQWFPDANQRLDYLQLDIDPSTNTLAVLKRLPLHDWRFSIITFETDAYTGDLRARNESRKILLDLGYKLLVGDVEVMFPPISKDPIAFEDWWIDPSSIDSPSVNQIEAQASQHKLPEIFLQ